ncbi:MAG: hypothetical protein K9M44_01000 [Candidatus Pacebacteria bacterium]|nr:hypothetical protein [Candidatus Paceibacterota bacterium]
MRKKLFIFIISLVFLGLAFFILPNPTLAVDVGLNQLNDNLELGNNDPRVVVARIIQIALGLLGLIAVVIILYAGFLWMTSGGSEEKVSKAKKTLTNGVIGLLIILASFGITTFILNSLLDATGAGNSNNNNNNNNVNLGLGALGACSVESVYPAPGQKDVPRNTSILVSFKEPVMLEDMCLDSNADATYCNQGDYINTDNIKIYKSSEPDQSLENVKIIDANPLDGPGMDFVLKPDNLLGSSSEKIWYTVYLTNDINKLSDGKGVFTTCSTDYLQWDFQVGTILDLMPPQVEVGGVFPGADNLRDEVASSTAVAAEGLITVNDFSQLKVYVPASMNMASTTTVVGDVDIDSATISPNYHQQLEEFSVFVLNPTKAQLFEGVGTTTLITIANINGNTVNFPNYFSLTFDANPEVGNLWEVIVNLEIFADTLRVGDIVYSFANSSGATKIEKGADNDEQADNILEALNNNPNIIATLDGNTVELTASSVGSGGNNIILNTSNSSAISLTPMTGGANSQINYIKNDAKDQPRNSVIQVNFNEPINPAMVSGRAEDVANTVKIISAEGDKVDEEACTEDKECLSYNCSDGGECVGNELAGKFVLSNQFSTLEFVSDNICGVNGCGETIYCLPAKSNLKVKITAAILNSCAIDDDCSGLDPYLTCSPAVSVCQNDALENYPAAPIDVSSGIVDLAFNSFDGNRNNKAEGPVSYYSENTPEDVSKGDSFTWSFYISDYIALEPPIINLIEPDVNGDNVNLASPVKIEFDSLMMKSTLKTGSTIIQSGNDSFTHRRVNLWGSAPYPLGYWINAEDIDTDTPLDGVDQTHVYINHSLFADSMAHTAEAGSGVKNIYQNCYKPSASLGCEATSGLPTCCNNVPTNSATCN